MAFNLRDTETQNSTTVPAGIYLLKPHVKRGGCGEDGSLRLAKKMRTMMLELEYTIVGGQYTDKKVWDYVTLELSDDPNTPSIDAE